MLWKAVLKAGCHGLHLTVKWAWVREQENAPMAPALFAVINDFMPE